MFASKTHPSIIFQANKSSSDNSNDATPRLASKANKKEGEAASKEEEEEEENRNDNATKGITDEESKSRQPKRSRRRDRSCSSRDSLYESGNNDTLNRDAEDKAPLAAEEEEEEEEVGDKASSTAAVAVVQDGDEDKDVVGESVIRKREEIWRKP